MDKTRVVNLIAAGVKKHDGLVRLIRQVARRVSPQNVLVLDYPVDMKSRWNQDHPHEKIRGILERNRSTYAAHLESFLSFSDHFLEIPVFPHSDPASVEPNWMNGWIHGLDAVALYSFIALNRPRYFMEVGSGNSTRFARKAIIDHDLDTKIISIDPDPRREIDSICDEVIRLPAEVVEPDRFDRLGEGDILFIDSSHRVLMNSDVTALLLDVVPRLRPGVLVEIHDVLLPFDYPDKWIERYFSEQYLLAAYLLAEGSKFEVVLPHTFINTDDQLRGILSPLWERPELENVKTGGSSFWMRIR